MLPDHVIAAGGIAHAAAAPDASDLLDAVAYVHPAAPGRVVIRLVPQALATGITTEMQLGGFAEQGRTAGVGRQRRRAPGFPGWALVHDPKNARYALDVMKGFAAAQKRIATKPGHARDAFADLAVQLGRAAPHFLPSFWEEAGRAFVAGGAIAMASSAFEKARAAEREHGLDVDEDDRADSFVEFAIAGALSVKSLLAWPAELKKSHGPEVAFVRLYDLALRRTLGGRAPWASLPKDLRDYAKAAKRDPAVEEGRFVRAVLGAVAMRRAPMGFWKDVAASIAAVSEDRATARALARLFPEVSGEDDITLWVGLLDRWGVLARLADEGLDGGLATWMGKALEAWDDAPAVLLGLATRLAGPLVKEGAPVPVLGEEMWRVTALDAYEALLAAGVPLQVVDASTRFALDTWAEAEGDHRDPVHLAADPVFGPILRTSTLNNLDEEAFQRIAPGLTAFREVRRTHLVETLARFDHGGVADLEEALDEVEAKVPRSTLEEFPTEAAPVATLDVTGALARTLTGGVLDELGWPALDAAVAELAGVKDAEIEVYTLAPWAVVTDGKRARVLGPAGQEGAFDLKLPKGATVTGFRWSAGQLLVVWREPGNWAERKGYWTGAPKSVGLITWEHGDDEAVTPARGGGVLSGVRILRPGDTTVDLTQTFCDAEGVWASETGVLHAVDAATGKLGPADAPAFLADRDGISPDLSNTMYHPCITGSPLGDTGDTYGFTSFQLDHLDEPAKAAWIARHAPRALRVGTLAADGGGPCVGIAKDGRAVVTASTPIAILRWPGSDTSRVLVDTGWREQTLLDPDGATLGKFDGDDTAWRAGTPLPLAPVLWHHLRPRDPAASTALRAADTALASRLLACADGLDDDDDGITALAARIREELPVTHPALARGIAGIVLHTRELRTRLEAWREASEAGTPAAEGPRDEDLRAALGGLTGRWGSDDTSVIATLRSASAFLDGADTKLAPTDLEWRDWLATPLALAFVALSPATDPAQRALIAQVLGALATTRFATPGAVRRVEVRAPKGAGWLVWEDHWGDRQLADAWRVASDGVRALCFSVEGDGESDEVVVELLLACTDGALVLPPGATLTRDTPLDIDPTAILHLLAAAPTLPLGEPVYAAISDATGLGRAEAACVWAGLRGLDRWNGDPLGKDVRERFGLKLAEVKAARDMLAGVSTTDRARAWHRALAGWDPADVDGLAARVGAAWAATFGKRAKVDDALLARSRQDFPGGEGPEALVELAGIASAPAYQADGTWKLDGDGDAVRAGDTDAVVFTPEALVRGVGTLLWLYTHTPGEDPLRTHAAALHTALLARMASPTLFLPVASGSGKAFVGWFKRFDGAAFVPADIDPEVAEKDRPAGKAREGLYAVSDGESVGVAVRPRELTASSREEVTRLTALEDNYQDGDPWRALGLLATPDLAAIVADQAPGWAQDPRRSAPELVPLLAAGHGLEADAAVLYLQLLALHDPTKANVLAWNGWKPAAYARAVGALVEKSLVVEAKRARAGRDHFLPGGWHERRSGSLPLEEWKLRWYGGDTPPFDTLLPLRPLGAIFRDAWARVSAGDPPRYEKRR